MSSKFRIIKRDLRSKISANITGASTQASTPTPTNPVEVKPLQTSGGMDVSDWNLHGIGAYTDIYNHQTQLITRNIGIKVLDGTNLVIVTTGWETGAACRYSDLGALAYAEGGTANTFKCSHLTVIGGSDTNNTLNITSSSYGIRFNFDSTVVPQGTPTSDRINIINAWLAAQYAAGTPVIVYYPLATPTTEASTPIYDESLIMRNTSLVPAGYTQLEYVSAESGITIRTEFTTGKFIHDIEFTGTTRRLMGSTTSSPYYWGAKDNNIYEMNNDTIQLHTNTRRIVTYAISNTQASLSVDGSTPIIASGTYTPGVYNIFSCGSSFLSTSGKLYSFQAYDTSDVLVSSMIPCKNSSNVVGLYDTVSGQFITPTIGTLTAGPESITKQFMIIQNEEA